jgi:hypothetical protein
MASNDSYNFFNAKTCIDLVEIFMELLLGGAIPFERAVKKIKDSLSR